MAQPDTMIHNNNDPLLYSPEKQAQLRDEALAKILVKGNKAGFATVLRLGQEVLARDSKKTGYFPARLVCKDNADRPIPMDHVRIHYDGRPEGEYRDVPSALVHYLPADAEYNNWCHLNILLSPWVLLDEMHNFENTPLLAYAKVFERTEWKKFRLLFDGTFELVDKLGRVVKVLPEWVDRHSTIHPDAIQEAIQAAKVHEQFLDLTYGARHANSNNNNSMIPPPSKVCSGPPLQYTNEPRDSHWLPASFASAIHAYAEDMRDPYLKDCARTIYMRGKRIKVDSQLRHNFVDLVNQIAHPYGYRMEALKFFHPLHQSYQVGSTPVVAGILEGQTGFGRCVSFYRKWVLDPALRYAAERTSEGLSTLYGKGDYDNAAWSYCFLPLRAPLRTGGHQQHSPQQQSSVGHSEEGLFRKRCRSRKRSRGGGGGGRNFHQHRPGPASVKRSRFNVAVVRR